MRNLCLIGLVKTSGLYIHTIELLPWYMDLATDLEEVRVYDDFDRIE